MTDRLLVERSVGRQSTGDVDREQEQRHSRGGRRAREQRVQVKTQTARDEEHRDEHAESSHLELQRNRRLYM
jgi:hypothetical protein